MILTWNTVFPRIIAGGSCRGQLFLFLYKKGAIIGRRRLFKLLLTGSRALNIMLYFPIKSKNNHVNILMGSWLNMGFFQSIPSLVPWLIFRAWIVTDQFCWVSLHFNLTGRIKGREDGERGRGGTIIHGQLVNRPLTRSSKFTRGTGNRQLAREIYMKMAWRR